MKMTKKRNIKVEKTIENVKQTKGCIADVSSSVRASSLSIKRDKGGGEGVSPKVLRQQRHYVPVVSGDWEDENWT
jgi:hypothetical protein